MGWGLQQQTETQQSEKVNFTKVPEGITKFRVLSEHAPIQRWEHWMPQFQRSVECTGKRTCPICAINARMKANDMPEAYQNRRKLSINIWNYNTNRYEIMEQSMTFMQDLEEVLIDLESDGKKLSDAVVKVKRRGMDTSSKYRIDVDEVREMEPEVKEAYDNQIDLSEYYLKPTPEQINQLLAVTENHKDAWMSIMFPQDGDTPSAEDEDIELA